MNDHRMGPKVIDKVDVKELVKLVNMKLKDSYELTVLDYDGFVQYLLQVANFMFT